MGITRAGPEWFVNFHGQAFVSVMVSPRIWLIGVRREARFTDVEHRWYFYLPFVRVQFWMWRKRVRKSNRERGLA